MSGAQNNRNDSCWRNHMTRQWDSFSCCFARFWAVRIIGHQLLKGRRDWPMSFFSRMISCDSEYIAGDCGNRRRKCEAPLHPTRHFQVWKYSKAVNLKTGTFIEIIESLQETLIFDCKNHWFPVDFPLNQSIEYQWIPEFAELGSSQVLCVYIDEIVRTSNAGYESRLSISNLRAVFCICVSLR